MDGILPRINSNWDTVSLPALRRRAYQAQSQNQRPYSVFGLFPALNALSPAVNPVQGYSRDGREASVASSAIFSDNGSQITNNRSGSFASTARSGSVAQSQSELISISRAGLAPPVPLTVTSLTKTTETRGQPGIVLALAEGRGAAHGEVGLAVIDLQTCVVHLGQYADTASYMKTITKIHVLEPCVVVISETMVSTQKPSPIFTILQELHRYNGPNIVTVKRKHFSEAIGMDLVKKLNLSTNSKLETELVSKYYCLASFAALVSYVEYEYKIVLAQQTLKINYMHMEDTCLIDTSTARNLELISNATDPRLVKQCLFGILNHTKTYAGGRLLRANLLQPFTKPETITMRLDCIEELIQTEDMFIGLQQILGRFIDVEKVIAFLVQSSKRENAKLSENHIGSFIHLKHVISLVEPLRNCIKDSENDLFRGFFELLSDGRYDEMKTVIDVLVHPEVKYEKGFLRMKTQKCYAVKPRINGCLDVARLLYSESVDDISALATKIQEHYSLPIQVAYDAGRGFHMQLFIGGKNSIQIDANSFPEEFIHVTKSRNIYSFTTKELVHLNGRSLECLREVFVLSHEMLKRVCESLRPLIGCLYELTECVATIDVLVSLTHACSLGEYSRPAFHDILVLEQSRHPVLEQTVPQPPVPNNAYSDEGSNFIIITGPNMAGKTTYMKQVALLQIMAQIGSFVPAGFASFRLFKQIFSRFGSSDDMQSNSSTFMMEMHDMHHICSYSNSDTLVLIDELGRGTSPEEGVGICWVLCEELLLTGATTFFVTHFEEICDLQHLYPNIHNVHFKTISIKNAGTVVEKLIHTHELVDGSSFDVRYGLALAEATSMPVEIIHDAAKMLDKIRKMKFTMGEDEDEFRKQEIECRHAGRVVQLANNKNLSYNDIVALLVQIKADYQSEMSALLHNSPTPIAEHTQNHHDLSAAQETGSQEVESSILQKAVAETASHYFSRSSPSLERRTVDRNAAVQQNERRVSSLVPAASDRDAISAGAINASPTEMDRNGECSGVPHDLLQNDNLSSILLELCDGMEDNPEFLVDLEAKNEFELEDDCSSDHVD